MAEDVSPSIGYKDEFWLDNGTELQKLYGLTEFDMPVGGTREQIDVTDLDAPDWRRQYISGFYDDADFTLSLNYRPGSDTDILLTEARTDGDVRDFRAIVAVQGEPTQEVTGTVRVTGYGPDRISVGSVKTATAQIRVVSVSDPEDYVAPETPTPTPG
jgi:hypothetical protein